MTRHHRFVATLLVLLISLTSVALFLRVVRWDPAELVLEAPAGESSSQHAHLRSRAELRNLGLLPSPSLIELIEITPKSIAKVKRHSALDVVLDIAPPADTPIGEEIKGHVWPVVTIFRRLHIPVGPSLHVKITVMPVGLPPDPGPDNDLTLEGIDSDRDGLRDDIQRYIALNFTDPDRIAALRQIARSMQFTIRVGAEADTAALEEAILSAAAASECMFARFGTSNAELVDLEIRIRNTQQRIQAIEAFSALADGKTFPSTSPTFASACD